MSDKKYFFVTIRMSEQMATAVRVKASRKNISRSAYIRGLCAADVEAKRK